MLQVNFTPYPELATARLRLRCITQADAHELFLLRSDGDVLKYLDRAPMESEKEAADFIKVILDNLEKNEGILWVITFKDEPGKMIGTIGFWKLNKDHYRAEIGYLLHPSHWNKGIMREALLRVADYGFREMGLHSIEANINPKNVASAILLEKAGFIREGYFRESYYYNGTFTDAAIYSLINPH